MSFRLHVIRHAEGTHNPHHDTSILDPELTETGIQQSKALCHDFPFKENVGLVIASPLRRTLKTALLGFEKCLDKQFYANQSGVEQGAKLLVEPDVQAHSARPCDTGSEWSVLKAEFPDLPWDTIEVDEVFPAKTGRYAPQWEFLQQRGWDLQSRMKEQFREMEGSQRKDIVVVTHGGFMKFVTGDSRLGVGPAKWASFDVSFDEESRLVLGECISSE
ncbi:Histidine phosphatase superfamily clade-1 [Penicillium malachiteum]|uniref:Histidine phosphatase superfamily clade-1 n=1 Tax=Penicillium malachiteum TaxID=1324776 RepID=UPI00254968FF|nr:Histidine phosphatase superfamily clade-1 [Penicillium malachiteum]KAJ5735224.1 Histidine phosphatase superfamily clade-1 [Penicillium malachiteum]